MPSTDSTAQLHSTDCFLSSHARLLVPPCGSISRGLTFRWTDKIAVSFHRGISRPFATASPQRACMRPLPSCRQILAVALGIHGRNPTLSLTSARLLLLQPVQSFKANLGLWVDFDVQKYSVWNIALWGPEMPLGPTSSPVAFLLVCLLFPRLCSAHF